MPSYGQFGPTYKSTTNYGRLFQIEVSPAELSSSGPCLLTSLLHHLTMNLFPDGVTLVFGVRGLLESRNIYPNLMIIASIKLAFRRIFSRLIERK
jgi:hypothetical protein